MNRSREIGERGEEDKEEEKKKVWERNRERIAEEGKKMLRLSHHFK